MNENLIYGWKDILRVGDEVKVKKSNHLSKISEVVDVGHCKVYRLESPYWKLNWHFRIYLGKQNIGV